MQGYQFPHSTPEGPPAPEDPRKGTKVSQKDANFRPAGNSETNCGSCRHYMGDGICEVVDGLVGPQGVSDLWEARKSMVDLI